MSLRTRLAAMEKKIGSERDPMLATNLFRAILGKSEEDRTPVPPELINEGLRRSPDCISHKFAIIAMDIERERRAKDTTPPENTA